MKQDKPMLDRVTFRLDPELTAQIRIEAKRNHMTTSDIIRWALSEGLADMALFDIDARVAERLAEIREFIVSRLKGGE
jgi:predicted DNA-binding protein